MNHIEDCKHTWCSNMPVSWPTLAADLSISPHFIVSNLLSALWYSERDNSKSFKVTADELWYRNTWVSANWCQHRKNNQNTEWWLSVILFQRWDFTTRETSSTIESFISVNCPSKIRLDAHGSKYSWSIGIIQCTTEMQCTFSNHNLIAMDKSASLRLVLVITFQIGCIQTLIVGATDSIQFGVWKLTPAKEAGK